MTNFSCDIDWTAGYDQFAHEFVTLVTSYPPPFLYINDQVACRSTSSVVKNIIKNLPSLSPEVSKGRTIRSAAVDATLCFTSRLLYNSILNSLALWEVKWDEGCRNWSENENESRWNDSLDGFLHGLQALSSSLAKDPEMSDVKETEPVRFLITVAHAHKLQENLPELIVPLTRLAELARLDITVIFISEVQWEDMRPSFGSASDPYFIDISPPTKENIVKSITNKYSFLSSQTSSISNGRFHNDYHPSFQGLYSHFIVVLCDVCYPFTHDIQDIEYLAAARWPGFIKPIIDEEIRKTGATQEKDGNDSGQASYAFDSFTLTEETRMRLSRLFNPSLTTALDALLPRLTNATDWALANCPQDNLLHISTQEVRPQSLKEMMPTQENDGMNLLPRMSKYLLIAAFLASMNPSKSDLRMFGRGLDEKKRKRRMINTRKNKSGSTKISQRFIGPVPFSLDRLIAILGVLLEENDPETRLFAQDYTIPGEHTDMEISRVGILGSIMELSTIRLLHRTSSPDRLEGPPMFKCNISYDATLALARQLKIPLNDLIWDTL